MSSKLTRIAELAKNNKALQFLSIAHLVTVEAMERGFRRLRKEAGAGVDGVTYTQYGRSLGGIWKSFTSG